MADELTIEEFEQLPAAARVSLRRFGQRTRLQLADITLAAATAARLVPNNPDRLDLLIVNSGSANSAAVTSDQERSVTQGDVIGANGGAYALDALEDGEATGREAWGISTAGTTIHIEEVLGYGPIVRLPPGVTPL